MNKDFIAKWFKENCGVDTVNFGSYMLFFLALFLEQTNPTIFENKSYYINSSNIFIIFNKLKQKGWQEVIIDENLLDFIADVDDILTALAFK